MDYLPMQLAATILYLLAGAGLNRLRGWGPYPEGLVLSFRQRLFKRLVDKVVAVPFYFGIITFLYTGNWYAGVIAAIGYQIWAIPGWGDYWDASDKPNHEVGFIDDLFEDEPEGWKRDLFSMCARGLIGWPTFVGLAFMQPGVTWPALFWGLGLALQGVIYHGFRIFYPTAAWVRKSEYAMGLLWTGLIALSVP